jgi:2-C-methyl-D-erythritol 4-phosphate cytidylyltransferase
VQGLNIKEKNMKTSVVIVCAGNSTRMGGVNKILLPLGKRKVIGVTMQAFQSCESVSEIIIVAREDDIPAIQAEAEAAGITKLAACTTGGSTRQESVFNGVRKISKDTELVAIHDGARPLVKPEHIEKVIKDASVFGGATLGVPVKDTIKTVDGGLIIDTPPRSSLYITQTPQIFKRRLYFEGIDFALEHGLDFTDDCQLVEAIGGKVAMTVGDYTNIKITTPEDIAIAEVLLQS